MTVISSRQSGEPMDSVLTETAIPFQPSNFGEANRRTEPKRTDSHSPPTLLAKHPEGLEIARHLSFVDAIRSIADPLNQVDELLRATLRNRHADVDEILVHVAALGGKHLRPALTLLSAQAIGRITLETIRLATVVELVHMATLVHDDVIDAATIRRHQPTVHVRWGVRPSILSGDWLFTQAYHMASCSESTLPGRWIAEAACQVCEGEIRQNATTGNFEISQAEYFNILAAKTGQLCGVACSIGAWSAGAPVKVCEALHAFGTNLGIAFQIYDDWLDVWGSEAYTGKTLGTDLAARKPTLPLLRLLETSFPDVRQAIVAALSSSCVDSCASLAPDNLSRPVNPNRSENSKDDCSPNDRAKVLNSELFNRLFANADANQFTRQSAQRFVNQAIDLLEMIPDGPAKQSLICLSNSAVNHSVR